MSSFITQCPHCETSFKITQAQLKLAKGKVRCGFCLRTFSALEQQLFIEEELEMNQSLLNAKKSNIENENDTFENKLENNVATAEHIEETAPDQNLEEEILKDAKEESHHTNSLSETNSDSEENADITISLPEQNQAVTELFEELDKFEDLNDDQSTNDLKEDDAALIEETLIEASLIEETILEESTKEETDDINTEDGADASTNTTWSAATESVIDEETSFSKGLRADSNLYNELNVELNAGVDIGLDADIEADKKADVESDVEADVESNAEDEITEADSQQALKEYVPEIDTSSVSNSPTKTRKKEELQKLEALYDDEGLNTDGSNPVNALGEEPIPIYRQYSRPVFFTFLLYFANALLIIALVAQYAWSNFDAYLRESRFSALTTFVCNYANCPDVQRFDLSSFSTDELIVNTHPTISNALQIDFIFSNTAEFEQAFPLVELNFSDLNRRLVANRLFKPEEYLEQDLQQFSHLPPNSSIQIRLEIADPGAAAINYSLALRTP